MTQNPFVKFRTQLDSYKSVVEGHLSDDEFVEIVETLDAAVAAVGGVGFVETPIIDGSALAAEAGLNIELWIKLDAGNVGGSHKARHLFGTAIQMLVDERMGKPVAENLAIASCGNAAMGAGVVAAAMGRNLDVYVPVWADKIVVGRLDALGATVHHCERREGESGDPAYLRFGDAVNAGAGAFSVQGTDTFSTFDGGRTLGWEFASQVSGIETLYIQVGGGALSTAVSRAMPDATVMPVQTQGCAPLRRAWDLLAPDFDFETAALDSSKYMWPWEDEPESLADGILDDVTYDWHPLLQRTKATGGEPIVVPEHRVIEAFELANRHSDLPVTATATAGLAGLLHEPPKQGTKVGLLFTGIDRAAKEEDSQ